MKLASKKIFRNGVGLETILLAFTRAVTMVTGIVVTRLLSTELSLLEYGTYSEALTIISVITSITIFGLVDSTIYFFNSSKNEEEQKRVVNTIFFIEILLSVIAAVVVISMSSLIVDYYSNPALYQLMIIIVLQPFVDNLFNIVSSLFVAHGRSKVLAFRNGIMSLIRVGTVCLGIFLFHSVFWVLLLGLIISSVQFVLFWLWYKKYSHLINPFVIDFKKAKTIIAFAFSVFLIIVTNTLMKQCDKLVLGNLVSVEDIAIFENASKQLPFDIIVAAIGTISAPIISKLVITNNKESLASFLRPFNTICLLSLIVLAFPAIICHNEFMVFLYGDKFVNASSIFIVYTIAEIIKFSNISIIIITKNKKMELALVLLMCLILNIGMDKLLFRYYGMIGCAFGTLIITTLVQIYLLIRSCSLTGLKLLQIIDLKTILLAILECATVAIILFLTKKYIDAAIKNEIARLFVIYVPIVIVLLLANIKAIKQSYSILNTFSLRKD